MAKKQLLNRLEIVLKEQQIEPKDFCELWNVKKIDSVWRNLRNDSQPTLQELMKASDILNVPLRELIVDYKPAPKS